jgi:glyoxylase-like metal-dependent hydrolase (beta-lactamase superfamily II)
LLDDIASSDPPAYLRRCFAEGVSTPTLSVERMQQLAVCAMVLDSVLNDRDYDSLEPELIADWRAHYGQRFATIKDTALAALHRTLEEYVRPNLDASHLIVDQGRAAFVDTGTALSVPNLLAALASHDVGVDDVDYILLTHVHLDHAGGAGALAAALPRARVLLHPRGVRHVIDPTVLVAAAQAVYGAARFREQHGDVRGIPAERVAAVADGERVKVGGRSFEFIHTPGHAMHHLCIVDRDSNVVFTGDTFGVSYREFDTAAGEFIFPTTTPSQFDPEQLHASINRILEFKPKTAYLTHYGPVREVQKLGLDLHTDIDEFVRIATGVADQPRRIERMAAAIFDYLSARLDDHGYSGRAQERHALLDGDIELNAAGLDAWLSRRSA